MWIVRASTPGVPLAEAMEQPLTTVYRSKWEWSAKFVRWLYSRYGRVSILILEGEEAKS